MRVLYFGTYERDYPRNAEVIACLRAAGVEVAEWHSPVWEGQRHKYAAGVGAALRLARAELRLVRLHRPKVDFDVLIVGYPGHFDMPLARRVAGKRPLVFNPAVSLYDALVLDRRRWKPSSLPARVLKAGDRYAFRAADLVVADTEGNADFLVDFAVLDRARVAVCFLGADESFFRPGWRRTDPFRCFFHGKLIPNHGLETILEAARLAPELEFRIAGTGQLERLLEDGLPANVEWVRWIEKSLLPQELWSAGCALGIFGQSEKVGRVIATKTVEALACGTPVVTADTPGARELLTDGVDALLVPPGDPVALAHAVRRLAGAGDLAERIGAAGARVYRDRVSQAVLGARWRSLLEELVAR